MTFLIIFELNNYSKKFLVSVDLDINVDCYPRGERNLTK